MFLDGRMVRPQFQIESLEKLSNGIKYSRLNNHDWILLSHAHNNYDHVHFGCDAFQVLFYFA